MEQRLRCQQPAAGVEIADAVISKRRGWIDAGQPDQVHHFAFLCFVGKVISFDQQRNAILLNSL
jgi:hypothetical protein